MLKLAGVSVPAWMEGQPILSGEFPRRNVLFSARDRCGDAMDRIHAVISTDAWIMSSMDRGVTGDPPTEPPLEQIQKGKRVDYQRTWKTRLQVLEPSDAQRLSWWISCYGLE